MAYNLNNHSRAVLAAHLLASEVIGAGCDGPLSHTRPNWVNYLTLVGTHRGKNRVHLADAFCGMCGVRPPSIIPSLTLNEMDLPAGFSSFISSNGIRVALVIGSGDVDRRIPLQMWEEWIRTFLTACPEGRVILIGGTGERELTHTLLDRMPSLSMSRIWDACGQTSLTQLATILSQCTWVVGSDTGPLHLGVACGAKVQGFYFSRARVHETGPYGHGHWVWQAETSNQYEIGEIEGVVVGEGTDSQTGNVSIKPDQWPIKESVELLLTETCSSVIPEGWSLWSSHADDWGAYFIQYADSSREGVGEREQIWKTLHDKNVDWEAVREHMSMPTYSHVTEQTI
ncbi:MAG: hypothetical protein NPIRA05_14870 [Nitrospirales bacterium]|nr:MAG: hypothetical protein NPIRA05_14870 [Nitrospirales bacterium]